MTQDLDLQIYGLWYQPIWHTKWFWGLVLVGVSVIVIGAYLLYRKYHGKQAQLLYQKLSPQQQALVALKRLDKKINSLHDSREFYGQLVGALKTFLLAKYAEHDLLSLTDHELYQFLRRQGGLNLAQLDLLAELLTARSQARFAALSFDQALARHDLYRVMEFIEAAN